MAGIDASLRLAHSLIMAPIACAVRPVAFSCDDARLQTLRTLRHLVPEPYAPPLRVVHEAARRAVALFRLVPADACARYFDADTIQTMRRLSAGRVESLDAALPALTQVHHALARNGYEVEPQPGQAEYLPPSLLCDMRCLTPRMDTMVRTLSALYDVHIPDADMPVTGWAVSVLEAVEQQLVTFIRTGHVSLEEFSAVQPAAGRHVQTMIDARHAGTQLPLNATMRRALLQFGLFACYARQHTAVLRTLPIDVLELPLATVRHLQRHGVAIIDDLYRTDRWLTAAEKLHGMSARLENMGLPSIRDGIHSSVRRCAIRRDARLAEHPWSPVTARHLRRIGVTTFDALCAHTPDELRATLCGSRDIVLHEIQSVLADMGLALARPLDDRPATPLQELVGVLPATRAALVAAGISSMALLSTHAGAELTARTHGMVGPAALTYIQSVLSVEEHGLPDPTW